jgi:hypothetical protein
MSVSKRQRKNYALRLQPYEGSLLGEVVDYLNGLDRDDANRKISELLTIGLLPLARYERGLSERVLRASTLESCNALAQHAHCLRQVVGVSVELPLEGDVLRSPAPSSVKSSQRKIEQKSQHPKSEFGSVDGLDDLFG